MNTFTDHVFEYPSIIMEPPPAYETAAALTSMSYGADSNRPEINLYDNLAERRKYDELAELYAIFKATESLEGAYIKDVISPGDYNEVRNSTNRCIRRRVPDTCYYRSFPNTNTQ